MSTFASRLRTVLNIHADESRLAALVIGVMLLTSAGFTLGSTSIGTLFLTRFGVEYLPYMYLPLGIISLVTSLGITALLARVRREALYIFIPIGIAVLTVIAWLMLFSTWKSIYPILWLGKEVINSLVSLVVWGIASTVCDTRQSKRLFPLFNAGRILGAVIGGFGTGFLVNQIGTQNLLLVWAGMLLLAFALTRALMKDRIPVEQVRKTHRKQKQPTLIQEMQQGFQFVRGSSLMIWVSLAAIFFSILYRCIDLPFAQAASMQYLGNEKSLAGFLGLFEGLTTATAFLASTFIANRLYMRFGIMNAILALPVIYLIGFGGLALTNTFAVIIAFRFIQMLWLSGIADSAYQAMFNAVPASRRDQVRAFIGGVPEQAGTILAGLVTIVFGSHQLAFVGLAVAIVTTFIIWRAGRAYSFTLVDSLRKGRPTIFGQDNRPDAIAISAALNGMKHPDPMVRRISAEIISTHSSATDALVHALFDEDMNVCISALKGLTRLQASSALLDIASLLSAPQSEVRSQAVDSLRALTPYPRGLSAMLDPMLNDKDAQVRVRTIVALLSIDPSHPSRNVLRQMSIIGDGDERAMALNALAEVGDPNALLLFSNELNDEYAPIAVRSAAASALASCGNEAILELKNALASENLSLKASAAAALGKIGDASLPATLDSLSEPDSEEGALLTLNQLSVWKEAVRLRKYVKTRVESSIYYENLRLAIRHPENERIHLLTDSLQSRARRDAIYALKALGLLGERDTISVAIESLQSNDSAQHANALETLETIREAAFIRSLFRIWEPGNETQPMMKAQAVIAELLNEKDEWLRVCAIFAKDEPMETLTTLSTMERVLLLRRVPLLADLPPADLQRVAAIATEHDFVEGEIICEQGEIGNEMYVIVSGEVRIVVNSEAQFGKEIARRTAGAIVGEMSIISRDTRMASVIAIGDVRVLCLDRMSFESLLRERPEVSLAVMRELCSRLSEFK
ncbi:MAG: cyclic nucleotide-binding domain-containing protein [Chloroflexi bacterium]|nr:cyclic nucleotide-binding domain-containing protein [Chloroflexota bacterium]